MQPVIHEIYSDSGRTIGAVLPGHAIYDAMPRFTGRAEPGSLVEIFSWGVKLGEGYANDEGIFSFVTTTPFADGQQSIYIKSTLASGESAESPSFSLHYHAIKHPVDADQPVNQEPVLSKPVIEGAYDNRNGEKLIEDGVTADTTPLLKGSADPLTIVYFSDFLGNSVGSVQANEEGRWELEVSGFIEGPIYATAVDANNPASVSYQSVGIAIQIQPGISPVIDSIYDDVNVSGFVSKGGVTDDPRPTVSGKADPFSLVKIYSSRTQKVLGEGYADKDGKFSFETTEPLTPGINTLVATSTLDGITSNADSVFSLTFTPRSGVTDPFIPPYALEAAIDEPGRETVGDGATTTDFTPTLTGKANAFAMVVIRINNKIVKEVQANANGIWIWEPTDPLVPGENVFTFAAIDNGMDMISEKSFTLNIALSVSIEYAEDNVGENIDNLSAGQSTDDSQPTLRGMGTPNSIVRIHTEKGLLGSALVNEKGEWSFTPEKAMAPGKYRFRPVIEHPDVDLPIGGAYFELTITPTVSLIPEVLYVTDNEGYGGVLESGAATDDATPTFAGFVDAAGAIVVIRDGGNAIGSVVVNDLGDWIYTPQPALKPGSHSLTFEIVDRLGDVHASEPYLLQVIPPVVTAILHADDNVGNEMATLVSGARTDDTTPTFFGQGVADSTLAVYVNDEYYGEAKTDPWGIWIWMPSKPLGEGEQTFTFITTDDKGQEYRSEDFMLLIGLPTSLAILSADDDIGTATDTLLTGSTTDDTQPTLRGTGMPNAIMEIFTAQGVLGSTKIKADGNWSFTPDEPLPAGTHEFKGMVHWAGETNFTQSFELTITPPETTNAINLRSLLQDGDAPLFAETDADLRTTQPVEPTAFVPASGSLTEEWESTPNHY